MGVVIVPGRFVAPPSQVGKLAGTLLGVALAGSVERSRLSRARQLQVDGAVLRLEVLPGTLLATVQGSRREPYSVTVDVTTLQLEPLSAPLARADVPMLVPQPSELVMRCSCPDWEDPCKHAVAAMLVLAAEISMRPELLREWRDGRSAPPPAHVTTDEAVRPVPPLVVGPRHGRDLAPLVQRRQEGSLRHRPAEHEAMAHVEWQEFVGEPSTNVGPAVPSEVVQTGAPAAGGIDLVEWLASAHDAMRRGRAAP